MSASNDEAAKIVEKDKQSSGLGGWFAELFKKYIPIPTKETNSNEKEKEKAQSEPKSAGSSTSYGSFN